MDDKPHLTEHETLDISPQQADLDLLNEDIKTENYQGLNASIILVYLAMCIGNFCQLFQLVAAGAYRTQLTATVGGASVSIWVLQCLTFITTITAPMTAQLADIWGRKWLVVCLSTLNCVGVLVVSRANTMTMVIAGQVLSGLGFGAQSLYYAIPSEIVPRKYRPIAQGGINIAIALSGIFSLLVGAVLVQTGPEGWRLLWYILAGLLALTALLSLLFYNPPPRPLSQRLTSREKLQHLDWIGYALLTTGILLFSMALTWSDNPYTWTNVHIIAPFVIGTICLISLGCYNGFFKKDGLFHHALFKKDRNFAIAVCCIAVEGATFMSANSFFVLEMLVFFETSLFRAVLRFCIFFFGLLAGAGFAAVYESYTKTIRLPTAASYALIVLFDVLMATVKPSNGTAVWAYPIFLGFGVGCAVTGTVVAAQLSSPPALIGLTSGLMLGGRAFGASVGLPIYNSVFSSQLSKHLVPEVAAKVLPLGATAEMIPKIIQALAHLDIEALAKVDGITPQIIQAAIQGMQQAYTPAFRNVWIVGGCFALVATCASSFFVNPWDDFTMHVDAPLHEVLPKETIELGSKDGKVGVVDAALSTTGD